MRSATLTAAALVVLCVLEPSCLLGDPEADTTAGPADSTEQADEPSGPEQIGEAPQPMGRIPMWFGSKDFPFEDWIADDGTDVGGGCQRSITRLKFAVWHGETVDYRWSCAIEIDLPKRTKLLGKISASRASLWTAQAANLAGPLLMDSRAAEDWIGQGEAYCIQLYPRLERLMNSQHKGLGARVYRP